MEDPKVIVLHENQEWVAPLLQALEALPVPYDEWLLTEAYIDLQDTPPNGVFYSKMSASAHTRGHQHAIHLALPMVQWLQMHGRRVINGEATVLTEVSKARQYLLLQEAGLQTPRTYIANGPKSLLEAAERFGDAPFVVKPNCGGKGWGVQLFRSRDSLADWVESGQPASADGLFVVQAYIAPLNSEIVRMEFIGGKFHYAVMVDTSEGFELCPADACEIQVERGPKSSKMKFRVIEGFDNPDVPRIEQFLKDQAIDIAGIEFVENERGERFIYDINTNTNYNVEAESHASVQPGVNRLAAYLQEELQAHYPQATNSLAG